MTEESNLPQPPPALLDLLQRLETRLDELDAVRDEVRTIREALDAPQPSVAIVSEAALHASATIIATGHVERPGMGSGSGNLHFDGRGEGHAPTIEDASTRDWLSNMQKRGGQAAKVADVATRLIYLAAKLGEIL